MDEETTLETVLKQRPFTPFRLHLSNGNTLDVTHPDGIMVTKRMLAIAVADSLTFVQPMHVVEVEPRPTVSK